MNRIIRTTAAVLITALIVTLLAPMSALAAGTTIDTQPRTPDQIRAYAKSVGLSAETGFTYTQTPSVTAPYRAGAVDSKTQRAFLAALNTARYIAGLDPVIWDNSTQEQTQAAALVMTLNGVISHYPAKPAGLDAGLYNTGYKGCGTSNIAGGTGYRQNAAYDPVNINWMTSSPLHAVMDWINDTDSYNIARMGHRRWCLNPAMGKSSFGAVVTENSGFSAMSSMDTSNSFNLPDYVAWPARQMPVELFSPNQAWTVSVPDASSALSVTVTNKKTGKTWKFGSGKNDGYFNIARNTPSFNIGTGDCIIFKPTGITTNSGDVYDVTVDGLSSPLSYSVSFFKLNMNLSGNADNQTAGDDTARPPAAPTKVKAAAAADKVTLTWGGVPDAAGYEIRYSTDNKTFKLLNATAGKSYVHAKLKPGTKYYYKVRAYNSDSGKKVYGEYSKTVSATTKLAAPKAVKATAVKKGTAKVSWGAVTGASGFVVERSANKKNYKAVKTLAAAAKSLTDTKLKAGTYYYRVRAFKTVNGKKVYGTYSTVVTVKVK